MKPTKLNYHRIIRIEILILVALFGFILFKVYKSNPAIREAIVLATTVKPETFTELYFENHTQLSDTITRWQEYPFSFTIHNLEYKDMEYPYTVYLQRDNEKIILSQGSVSLKQDEYKTIEDTVGPFKDLRTKIVVELTNKNQIISYWLDGTYNTIQAKVTPQPEQVVVTQSKQTETPLKIYTQLYFKGQLPYIVTPQNKTISFSFAIQNFKNKDSIIPYEVYMDNNGQIIQIDRNQISLKQNEVKTITESYTLTNPINQAKIFVKLPNENNYIYFNLKQIQ
jgi:hypothetical protein